ncbi:Endoprotease FURIN [Operophtera brumata]|uniref:Endoprotease FURIN n=1 Tax=Operophtera brumata TaxID=104452 RepID=A0A0L7L0C9_OPEBR|nr:Endoprotease FURIN [Operophtera brumata]
MTTWRGLALLAALHVCACARDALYHNQFAVHVPDGARHVDDIAKRHGYVNHGQAQKKKQ